MELTNDFRVALPVDRAWAVLTDVELIAPCMPGAQLQEIDGDEYRGVVKVKVGPITAQYKGQATFERQDEAAGVLVLRAEGRETRGQGNASATITATLSPEGDGTAVSVITDLTVTGRVAQFGRGVLADVSAKLLGQFVECLEQTVLADSAPAGGVPAVDSAPAAAPTAEAAEAAEATEVATAAVAVSAPEGASEPGPSGAAVGTAAQAPMTGTGPRRVDHPEAQPVDLIGAAGTPVAKRVGPILALVAVVWLLRKLLTRNKK